MSVTRTQVVIDKKNLDSGRIEVSATPIVQNVPVILHGQRTIGIVSEEELRSVAQVPDNYTTEVFKPNSWVQQDSAGPFIAYQAKATFRPPEPEEGAINELLIELGKRSPRVSKIKHTAVRDKNKNMLEISIPDLHLGSIIEPNIWNYDIASSTFMWAIEELLAMASQYETEEILFPCGSDFLHTDTQNGTTTRGTYLQDSGDFQYSFKRGVDLLIEAIDRLKEVAPVSVLCVPGNHDFNNMIHMGQVIEAYYRNDSNVTVDADRRPYKFKRYGNSMIGYEHGCEKSGPRMTTLPALMANENPQDWAETKYREWHLGDRHRQGAVSFADQGVVIEYLPSLTASNEWMTKKGYNHQRRAALAFVWDKIRGPVARLQVNIEPN